MKIKKSPTIKRRWYKFWIQVYNTTYIITYKNLPQKLTHEQLNKYFDRWANTIDTWFESITPLKCGWTKTNKPFWRTKK